MSKILREPLLVIGISAFLTYLSFSWLGVQFEQISTAYFGDYGDTLLNSWALHQATENLLQRPADLGYSPMFYGYPQSFAYTIAPYGIAITVLPFHLLTGSNIILTYNVYLFATFVLTAVAGYLLIRHLTGVAFVPALLGALMITFSQFRFQHFVQIESLSFHLLLFALYGFHKLLQTLSIR
ncbi:MAG: hypothetical protein H7X77_01470, partial [Anaerolineae bacterium]|nr:hypothetical protein [Anaerolineae bacterium]